MNVTVTDGKLIIKSVYAERTKIRSVPGVRWNDVAKCWTLPATPGYLARLREVAESGDIFDWPALAAIGEKLTRRASAARPAMLGCGLHARLWKHQAAAVDRGATNDACMLHMWMGTGKTLTTLSIIEARHHWRTLVVCPKSVGQVWAKEVTKHDFDYEVLNLCDGGSIEQRAATLVLDFETAQAPLLVVVNYDAMWRGALATAILKRTWHLLVLDESQRIKAPGGKASRFAERIPAGHRLALTGTPMPHSPLDIYAQYRALDPGIFGTSFQSFKSQYAVMGGFQNYQVVGYRNEDDLRRRMDSIRHEVKAEALDLPPITTEDIPITLDSASAKHYREMEQLFVTAVKGGEITASNALAKLLRLQQITSGYLPLPDSDGKVEQVGSDKRAALSDLIDGAGGEPMVVFCRFRHDLDQIAAVCGEQKRRYGEISGRVHQIAEWDAGAVDVLGVQIQAGGLGIDLTRARYSVYFSLGYSLGDYVQSVARVHRPGQTRPVTIYRLLATGTVDERIAAALDAKKEVIDSILEAMGYVANG